MENTAHIASHPARNVAYQRIATEEAFAPPKMQDLDQIRLQHMDEAGIDRQVIALTAPGVRVMDQATAVSFSRLANDQPAEAVRRHPTRFTGMIAVAPQDPAAAAKEIERGVNQFGMNAAIINSQTQGEYLSDSKFRDIFAAAVLGLPAGLHAPRHRAVEPVRERQTPAQ